LGPVRFTLLLGVITACIPAIAGNISFHPRVDLSTGSSKPIRIAIADFNGDGKLDIAAPDYFGQDLLIYLNKGDGTFGAPIINTLQITNTLDALVASDVDKDVSNLSEFRRCG
jgi:FG-GAP-like repeat